MNAMRNPGALAAAGVEEIADKSAGCHQNSMGPWKHNPPRQGRNDTWVSIGQLATRLVQRAGGAA